VISQHFRVVLELEFESEQPVTANWVEDEVAALVMVVDGSNTETVVAGLSFIEPVTELVDVINLTADHHQSGKGSP